MAVGALKTLVTTLAASGFMSGVAVGFGEELIQAQDLGTPSVVVVPRGGPWSEPGYIRGLDPNVENVWATNESIDVWMWAFSTANGATAIDHADATETLRQQVLSAFQDQRVQANADGSAASGLYWKPITGRWEMLANAVNRYGRAYVLTVTAEIAVPCLTALTNVATITSETINNTITGGQHV